MLGDKRGIRGLQNVNEHRHKLLLKSTSFFLGKGTSMHEVFFEAFDVVYLCTVKTRCFINNKKKVFK